MMFLELFISHRNKSSSKKGKKYERRILQYLKKKILISNHGKIYSFENKKNYVEIDIETPSVAIEVKSGEGRGLKRQLDKYSDVTEKEPVALAPNMRYKAKVQARKYYKIFDSKKELRRYLLSKGDGKKGKG